jgi:hypothetical protein
MHSPIVVCDTVDTFHTYSPKEPWWTETVWFGAWIPEAAITIYFYNWFRPVLGIYGGGCLVWDGKGHLPWDAPVYRYDVNAPITSPVDLRDMSLPGGNWLKSVQEGMVYDMGYASPGVRLDMRFTGLLPAEETSAHGTSEFFAGHIDQPGHYTGTLELDGKRWNIDCHGIRDRSWGPRIIGDDIRLGYCHGQSADFAFLAYSKPGGEREPVFKGYVMQDGIKSMVKEGHRRVCYHGGELRWIEVHLTDELGRSVDIRGRPVNRFVYLPYANLVCWLFLMEWEGPTGVLYGEEQDAWSTALWRNRREIPAP